MESWLSRQNIPVAKQSGIFQNHRPEGGQAMSMTREEAVERREQK